ncbi:glycoside hydrolase family 115 protein [Patellaria atrata CBS 101060]|uniref:Glycoside hydrolase family 115 protein n=1 Tax=Patellaria atrata CBS 101060 TaxID=1346257 RepID=A0A9P4VSH3_9PEZI|nr:glycoside hydrolase family 115 protein [Patellaria atrata CBS 101060]
MHITTLLASILTLVSCTTAIGQPSTLTFSEGGEGLKLASSGLAPTIVLDSKEWPGVTRAANDLTNDFGLVIGTKGKVVTGTSSIGAAPAIIVGTIGKSAIIDSLVSSGKIDVSAIKGKWESFTSQLVTDPVSGVASALVIAGSDKRGSIYGIYDISEQIGVSPWYWWADVPPKKKTVIFAADKLKVQGPPSIKYRGIFLNDEQPALTNWINQFYGGKYNSNFHVKVFELLLRLRANYFWPAMWNSKFYVDDSKNGPLADEYGIVMGASHTEPMARADKEKVKPWDWNSNQNNLKKYMQDGVTRAKNWETLWTMGMRGDGDTASPTLTAASLTSVINYQQSILKSTLGVSDLSKVPMMWCLYKEVGGYYQQGMTVPNDITLLWSDDNSGNIQRLPVGNELSRPGNAGVYYHFDYVGDPRNYKWINSIQLTKTWEQMHLAHDKNATNIWIVNVGDLKPLEIPISHFLDMAYDMTQFKTPDSTGTWLKAWATREFGAEVADTTADIMTQYGKLIIRRKYEWLNTNPYVLSTTNYDEAESHYQEWVSMVDKAQSAYDSLDSATQISFFEMVLHPALAGKTVQEVYYKAALNTFYAKQKRMSANTMATEVRNAYSQDQAIAKRYHSLLNGKWNHMMDQVHFGYTYWQDPGSNSMPGVQTISTNAPSTGPVGVSVQGSANSAPGDATPPMLSLDPYTPENRTIDVYARGQGTFQFSITPDKTYVTVTPSSGTLSYPSGVSDIKAVIDVDWSAVPAGKSTVSIVVKPSTGNSVTLSLPLNKNSVPEDFKGHVESNGVVSFEMAHYTSKLPGTGGASMEVIPGYGRTHSGLTLMPGNAPSQSTSSGAKVSFDFYTFTSSSSAKVTVYLPPSFNINPSAPLKYAFSIDSGAATSVQPIPGYNLGSMPSGWSDSVVNGAKVVTSTTNISAGKHTLNLWALEPGTVFQKVVIDLGGVKQSYLGPPESVMV